MGCSPSQPAIAESVQWDDIKASLKTGDIVLLRSTESTSRLLLMGKADGNSVAWRDGYSRVAVVVKLTPTQSAEEAKASKGKTSKGGRENDVDTRALMLLDLAPQETTIAEAQDSTFNFRVRLSPVASVVFGVNSFGKPNYSGCGVRRLLGFHFTEEVFQKFSAFARDRMERVLTRDFADLTSVELESGMDSSTLDVSDLASATLATEAYQSLGLLQKPAARAGSGNGGSSGSGSGGGGGGGKPSGAHHRKSRSTRDPHAAAARARMARTLAGLSPSAYAYAVGVSAATAGDAALPLELKGCSLSPVIPVSLQQGRRVSWDESVMAVAGDHLLNLCRNQLNVDDAGRVQDAEGRVVAANPLFLNLTDRLPTLEPASAQVEARALQLSATENHREALTCYEQALQLLQLAQTNCTYYGPPLRMDGQLDVQFMERSAAKTAEYRSKIAALRQRLRITDELPSANRGGRGGDMDNSDESDDSSEEVVVASLYGVAAAPLPAGGGGESKGAAGEEEEEEEVLTATIVAEMKEAHSPSRVRARSPRHHRRGHSSGGGSSGGSRKGRRSKKKSKRSSRK